MRLAAALSLNVAPVEARVVEGRKFLQVERYDRAVNAAADLVRVHQEDFCQALGHAPEHKYAAEGGPTFKTSFGLLRAVSTRPAIDVLALLDTAIANLISGNCDAHGKNFSLLYSGQETRLAPLYDLMSTVAYPDVSATMAMNMGGAASLDTVTADTWSRFAQEAGIGVPFVRGRVAELARWTMGAVDDVADALSTPNLSSDETKALAHTVKLRALHLAEPKRA